MKVYKTTGIFFRIDDQSVKESQGEFLSPEVASNHNQRFLEETAGENGLPLNEIQKITQKEFEKIPGFVAQPGVIFETYCRLGNYRWLLHVYETTVNNETKPQH